MWQRYLGLSAHTGIVDSLAREFGQPAVDIAVKAKLALLPPDEDTVPAGRR